jgi:hypothetical protein
LFENKTFFFEAKHRQERSDATAKTNGFEALNKNQL